MPSAVRISAALVAVSLLLTGCTVTATQPTGQPDGQIHIAAVPGPAIDRPTLPAANPVVPGLVAGMNGEGLTDYLKQPLSWRDCDGGTQCAEVLAPLDYAEPRAQAVTLALRRRAASTTPKLGTLFINPGGPGASGTGLVANFDVTGLEQYDVVGWDPRGTGDSTPVRCSGDAQADAYNSLDFSPDDAAERTALIQGVYEFGKACWENSGILLEHISTIETVRDLDLLRQLVGDSELHFLGYSYGTQIGATYAELFPQFTGRLVLDAAVNITDNDDVIQAMGFDLALGNFASWCAGQKCRLGDTQPKVLRTITGLFDRLDSSPIAAGPRTLTQSLAVTGAAAMLYGGEAAWPVLADAIVAAAGGNGERLLRGADILNARNQRGHYGSLFFSFPAISCLDGGTDKGVLDADRLWTQDTGKAPIFGKYFGPQYQCTLWPVRPARQLKLLGVDAKPLLVIGGTGDNATPYQQAVSMAQQLKSGVLVTYSGEGHGSYGGKSSCVDKIVVDYLVRGTVPADGIRCG